MFKKNHFEDFEDDNFEDYDFYELRDNSSRCINGDLIIDLIDKIEEFIDENNINCYYPKNLDAIGENLEYILFTENTIFICKLKDNYELNIKGIPKTEIISTELNYTNSDTIILEINLVGDNKIILDSKKDTGNSSHSENFVELIKKIFQDIQEIYDEN